MNDHFSTQNHRFSGELLHHFFIFNRKIDSKSRHLYCNSLPDIIARTTELAALAHNFARAATFVGGLRRRPCGRLYKLSVCAVCFWDVWRNCIAGREQVLEKQSLVVEEIGAADAQYGGALVAVVASNLSELFP